MGLCGAVRVCPMAEPYSYGSFLVRACASGLPAGRVVACGVLLCLGWCCMPLWAHSTSTGMATRLWAAGMASVRAAEAACAEAGGVAERTEYEERRELQNMAVTTIIKIVVNFGQVVITI